MTASLSRKIVENVYHIIVTKRDATYTKTNQPESYLNNQQQYRADNFNQWITGCITITL